MKMFNSTIQSMIDIIKKYDKPKPKTLYCHPNNIRYLTDIIRDIHYSDECFYSNVTSYESVMHGIRIIQDESLPEFVPVWTFPADPFIEYEKSDEVWAIPLKIGCWKPSKDRAYYAIDEDFMKPIKLEMLQENNENYYSRQST